MSRLRFWLSTFIMLNIYVFLTFIVTAKNDYEVNSIHSHWLTVALVKVLFTYLYFHITRRTFFQFALAAIMGIAVRLGMGGSFLLVVLACQFYLEFYDGPQSRR